MPYYKFNQSDIVYNVLKTNPKAEFYIYQTQFMGGGVFYNSRYPNPGYFTASVPNANPYGYNLGEISLYEMNVDRTDQPDAYYTAAGGNGLIKAFIPKAGTFDSFKTISNSDFVAKEYGGELLASYPLTSSISRQLLDADAVPIGDDGLPDANGTTPHSITGSALKNTLNEYAKFSKHYLFEYPEGVPSANQQWNKAQQDINMISIPSIFYGSSIKKGSVELDFYITGTLVARLQDVNKNGELIQVTGAANDYGTAQGSGSVAGVVLYNEGFILLTGSWTLDGNVADKWPYTEVSTPLFPKWLYWGIGADINTRDSSWGNNDGSPARLRGVPSASFSLNFSGSTETPVLTMFAKAPAGAINHSNNTTYIKHGQNLEPKTGSFGYIESELTEIKNTTSSSYSDMTGSFSKNTYISKIGIFDKDKNLLGYAKLATPVKKSEERDLTFKLKLDI